MTRDRGGRPLSAGTEKWLRKNIPAWGQLRDKAVAAGVIDPSLPLTSEQQQKIEEIGRIAERVRRRLVRVGADPRPAKPSNTQ
jgi:hypothetical protein